MNTPRVIRSIACLVLLIGGWQQEPLASGQAFVPRRPEAPYFAPDARYVAEYRELGGIAMGKIDHVRLTGRTDERGWQHLVNEIKITIRLDRLLMGKMPKDHPWHEDSYWAAAGEMPQLGWREGDRILFGFRNFERQPFHGARDPLIVSVKPADIERIERIQRILEMKDSEADLQAVIEGCRDSDVYFATWCLGTLRKPAKDEEPAFAKAYHSIREVMPADHDLYREMMWKLIDSPATHHLLFEFCSKTILDESLSLEEQAALRQCYKQRLESIAEKRSSDFETNYYAQQDLIHIVQRTFPKFSPEHCLELLPILETLTEADQPRMLRHPASALASRLHHHGNAETYEALIAFYKRRLPPIADKDAVLLSLLDGLKTVIATEFKRTGCVDLPAVSLLANLVKLSDRESARVAARCFAQLTRKLHEEKADLSEFPQLMQSMYDGNPHAQVRRILQGQAELLDTTLKDSAP